MKTLMILILVFSISSNGHSAARSDFSRINEVVSFDTTEQLEKIADLKVALRKTSLEISTLEIAIEEAKKNVSTKRLWSKIRQISDAVTAFTILSGSIAAYHFENKVRVIKIASFIGGVSSAISIVTEVLEDMTPDELAALEERLDELKPLLKATNKHLEREVLYLCKQEPSNQMCL